MGNRTYEGVMALVQWRAKSVSGLRAHQTLFSCVPWSRITLTIGWCEIPRANGERPQMLPNPSRKWTSPLSAEFIFCASHHTHHPKPVLDLTGTDDTSTMRKNRRGTQGKLYTIKTQAACKKEGIAFTPLPKGVAGHMVIVLNQPDGHGNIKFATVCSEKHLIDQFQLT
jgi:hypothetical protein